MFFLIYLSKLLYYIVYISLILVEYCYCIMEKGLKEARALGAGAKLVRFSKVTRAIRIISVTRVVRIQEYLEHIGDRLHGGSSLPLGV